MPYWDKACLRGLGRRYGPGSGAQQNRYMLGTNGTHPARPRGDGLRVRPRGNRTIRGKAPPTHATAAVWL